MKKIDIKKNGKKKFNAFIQELINKLHIDEIQDIGTEEIIQTHPQIDGNFGDLAGLWWKTNSIGISSALYDFQIGLSYSSPRYTCSICRTLSCNSDLGPEPPLLVSNISL